MTPDRYSLWPGHVSDRWYIHDHAEDQLVKKSTGKPWSYEEQDKAQRKCDLLNRAHRSRIRKLLK